MKGNVTLEIPVTTIFDESIVYKLLGNATISHCESVVRYLDAVGFPVANPVFSLGSNVHHQ